MTIKEVAAAAEVSVGTVSNVLNRPNAVSDETRLKVLDAIDRLGFVRNAGASLLRGGRARTIGLITLDIRNPFFTELARSVEHTAREAGYLLVLCNSDENRTQEKRYLELLEEQRVNGVLISPVNERDNTLQWLRDRGTAVVLLGHDRRSFCSVRVDDVSGGELAADHLLDLGHRRLAFVTAPLTIAAYNSRLTGVRRALARRGLPDDACEVVEVGSLGTAAEGRVASDILVDDHPEVTAAVCGNDLLALGLIAGLLRHGIRVPGDISVVGYDDIELAEHSSLPLTTIRQPKQELGRVATNLLIEEGQRGAAHAHQQIVFQPEFVLRDTTAAGRRSAPRRRTEGR
ncbi:LacI family DNA-binding transcriptional regulator [Dactylosporangium sp. CA-233914]|uniref:LacI family DNA-binding transcriptional regulator n=1 Tax=Dactylosporangium sp. CA-233914 TaxID=3239934 RepID=UPI003D92E24E